MSDPVGEIRRLQDLHAQGAITDEEFARAKGQLLNQVGAPVNERRMNQPSTSPNSARDVSVWIHISAMAGWIIPLAGFVAPIIIWQVNKSTPLLDAHGKVVANWILSSTIYAVVSLILSLVLIGFIGLLALAVLGFVFPIMGAVRASRGELWPYPLSISFFK